MFAHHSPASAPDDPFVDRAARAYRSNERLEPPARGHEVDVDASVCLTLLALGAAPPVARALVRSGPFSAEATFCALVALWALVLLARDVAPRLAHRARPSARDAAAFARGARGASR
jgi:hypothetical protein